jgi:hypothetical protein
MTEKKPTQRINAELIYYQISEVNARLDKFETLFVTKAESAALKAEIAELRVDIAEIKKARTLINWLYPTMSAGFTAIFTYLIIEYLKAN